MKKYMFFLIILIFIPQNILADSIESIKVLDLKTAQKFALKNSPSLAVSINRIEQAKQRLLQARSANWPKLDASISGSRIWQSDTALSTLGPLDDPENYFSSGITGTWMLFDGFARKFRILGAKYSQHQSIQANKDAKRLLLWAVSTGYFNAQLAMENISIAKANKTFNLRQAKEAQARQKVGTGSLSDVLNFQIQVNAAKAELINAEKDYKTAMFALAAFMGIADAQFSQDMKLADLQKETDKELNLPKPESLIDYAQANHPDIIKNDYIVKQAKAGIKQAQAGYWPVINLLGSITGERTDNMGFKGDDFGTSIGITLKYNLFEGRNTQAKINEARAVKAGAENTLRDIKISVKSEILKAFETLKSSQTQLALQRSNARLVQQNRDLVEKEYKAGQASLVRLNEAQRDLTQAQSRLALSLVSLRQAWQNLYAATGEILINFEN